MKVNIFWFRRDLRLEDNVGLAKALASEYPVLPIFIFDKNILTQLKKDDARVSFIYKRLQKLNEQLKQYGSSLYCVHSTPEKAWSFLCNTFEIESIFANKDYEPYAIQRDKNIAHTLAKQNISFTLFKDQVIFEENDIVKADGSPYTVYTPYKKKWLALFEQKPIRPLKELNYKNFLPKEFEFPSLKRLNFEPSSIMVKDFSVNDISDYAETRDFPAKDKGSYLSPHLRFGTVSPRTLIANLNSSDAVFLSELIWREFFMQILFHFPKVVKENFKAKYNFIEWRNQEEDFELWCAGKTGYPIVDAGMRQLNETGYMHNRVRMVVASFLVKHLLIHWSWGEAYFAEKLLDYDLAANNGNWQWVAGTGCDAAPYFRVFNPSEQVKKFDKDFKYIRKWVKEFDSLDYPKPMVEHKMARERALKTYKEGLNKV